MMLKWGTFYEAVCLLFRLEDSLQNKLYLGFGIVFYLLKEPRYLLPTENPSTAVEFPGHPGLQFVDSLL